MKIKNITEPKTFFEVLNQCKGTVELVTSEGDRLNLKSKLCQYITLTQMFKMCIRDSYAPLPPGLRLPACRSSILQYLPIETVSWLYPSYFFMDSLTILSQSSSYEIPAAAASWGSRLVGVMTGRVLTYRQQRLPSDAKMKSARA